MPTASGDIREIVGQPVFVPLYRLFLTYGAVFRLAFGPKSFVVVSDPDLARQVLLTDAAKYTKGLLSEILDFVMGQGLIPADGEVWRERRRAIVPSLHRRYIGASLGMFGECALHGAKTLEARADAGEPVEMENFFSRLTLDIIGKAVFNYDFDSLTTDDPFIQAVYTVLREAEYRSTAFVPYWNVAPLRWIVPYPAGGTPDSTSRSVGEQVARILGTSVVVLAVHHPAMVAHQWATLDHVSNGRSKFFANVVDGSR
jgi:beta-ring hydroxylase